MGASRRWIFVTALSLLVLAAATGSYLWARNRQPLRLAATASTALDRDDYMGASLKARRALELDPDCLPACLVMAKLCDKTGNADAVSWRRRVVELSGDSSESLISGATTALRYSQPTLASSWLGMVQKSDQHRADFYAVSGSLAFNTGRPEDSERFYENAVRLAPSKTEYRFNLGNVQALSDDYFLRESGRKVLEGMSEDPEFGPQALRALIASYDASGEHGNALGACQRLLKSPQHTFSDSLQLLHLLLLTGNTDFDVALAQTETEAAHNPNDAGVLLAWMSSEGLAREGLDWANLRVSAIGKYVEVQPALGQCYLAVRDWENLLKLTGQGPWESAEYIRHAYRSRALREGGNLLTAESEWNSALDAAGEQPDDFTWLAHIARDWNWTDETVEALWGVVDHAPNNQWAIEALHQWYLSSGNTAGLLRLTDHIVKSDPTNEEAKNDFVMCSLLLNKDVERVASLAADLYHQYPKNPEFVSTYAFSLYRQGRTADALRLLDGLPRESFKDPSLAAYYGIMLVANKETKRARPYLDEAQRASLLPEEQALLQTANQEAASTPSN